MSRVSFTAGRVRSFQCPPGRQQAFMWDEVTRGLGLRTTPTGQPSYIFQGVYQGKTVRITIGSPADWSIEQARARVRELQRLTDQGTDPRELKRTAIAAQQEADAKAVEQAVAVQRAAVMVSTAWEDYIAARKAHWGERHLADHLRLSQAGGQPAKRGTRGRGVTIAGPLYALMNTRLGMLTPAAIEDWAARETASRPTVARLAWRQLKAFLAWCSEHPEYGAIAPQSNPAKARATREILGKTKAKNDVLLREQLKPWFTAVRAIRNQAQSAYLQTLLLTGARPNEILTIRRADVDFRWKRLTIRDKVEGERQIPLTPYVQSLLSALPKTTTWVFEGRSTKADVGSAPMSKPHKPHQRACAAAGIEGLTLQGLRRSLATLSEWLEIPAGVVAQIQGHKPSATREKHYIVRPLDLLRGHHERIEAWILEQAGVSFAPGPEKAKQATIKK